MSEYVSPDSGEERFVLQDFVTRGATNSITRGTSAYVPSRARSNVANVDPGADIPRASRPYTSETDGDAYMEYLRSTDVGAHAPYLKQNTRSEDIGRARMMIMQPGRQRTLADELAARTSDVATREAILARFDTLMRGYVNNLRLHVEALEASGGFSEDPAQFSALLEEDFLRDREALVRENPHMFSGVEDEAVRYNSGEYGSIYWDRNRALNTPQSAGPYAARLARRDNAPAPAQFVNSQSQSPSQSALAAIPAGAPLPILQPGARTLIARGTREPSIYVGAPGSEKFGADPQRYGRDNGDRYISGAGMPQRVGRGADRDHNFAMWASLQERSDRVPSNIRGRVLRETMRSDLTPLSAPLEVVARSTRVGGDVPGKMSDRQREARAGSLRWRETYETYRPDRWGTAPPPNFSVKSSGSS